MRLFSFGGYELALAALALVVFGAYDSYPTQRFVNLQQTRIVRVIFSLVTATTINVVVPAHIVAVKI